MSSDEQSGRFIPFDVGPGRIEFGAVTIGRQVHPNIDPLGRALRDEADRAGHAVAGTLPPITPYHHVTAHGLSQSAEDGLNALLADAVKPSPYLDTAYGYGIEFAPPFRARLRRRIREARSRVWLAWTALRYGEDYFR